MSYNNSRTFMQKHGLKIGVGVVSLIILIVAIVMLTGKKEEDEKPDLSPAAQDAVAFLQNTDQSDIDGTAGEETPPESEEEQPASTVETYMMIPGNKTPLDYTRF